MTDLTTRSTPKAAFRAMSESTVEDWRIIRSVEPDIPLADSLLEQLRRLGEAPSGFAVDRLTHSLQTATRAERAGRSTTTCWRPCCTTSATTWRPANHSELAAAVLRPHLPEDLHWMVKHHGEFQRYYFGHLLGEDRDVRERHRGHQWFDLTEEFCEEYDQRSFDPDYPDPTLEHYEPLVRR